MYITANIPTSPSVKRVVIVGGGFAGLELAKGLSRQLYQVVLIDRNNYHQFQPLFYQVATGGLEPSSISYPFRKIFQHKENIYFRMCEALNVDTPNNCLSTTIGNIHYDILVVATGCDTNYFGNNQLKSDTFALKSLSESLLLRNRILLSLEQATSAKDDNELEEILSFVIVGGGATGVELSGALADMRRTILPKDYPDIDFSKMKIHLIDGTPHLLSAMSTNSSKTAEKTLRRRGVILHQAIVVKSYNKPLVEMSDGSSIVSRNVFWVAGVKPNGLAGLAETSFNRGKIVVDEVNKVIGYDNIYAIGDTAGMLTEENPKGHPQVAQVALQMAQNVAYNLNNKDKKKNLRKFSYKNKGALATIGRNKAVADIANLHFGGFFAWCLWLLVHIMSLIGMRNKLSVLIDWLWNYLNYDASLRLFIRPKNNDMYAEKPFVKLKDLHPDQ